MKTLVVALVLVLIGSTAVYVLNRIGWAALTGKAWAITYEVTAQSGRRADVTYLESPDRYRRDRPSSYEVKAAQLPWSYEAIINSSEKAAVTAKPVGDEVLTCRILLDHTKELTRATAAPGQPVNCETTTGG